MKFILYLLAALLLLPQWTTAQTDYHQARRNKLIQLTEKGLIILANTGGMEQSGTPENLDFYYLTGSTNRNAVLVIDGRAGTSTLYQQTFRYRQPQVPEGLTGKDLGLFKSDLEPLLRRRSQSVWMDLSQIDLLEDSGESPMWGLSLTWVDAIRNVLPLIHKMRSFKDDLEIQTLEKAAEITANGLVEMMKSAEPGMVEKELELMLSFMFNLQGSNGLGFNIQAASGPNSTFVHYSVNDRTTQPGDMVVFDVGAKYENYTADISRTIPISGKFTKEQREIYEVVLNAQKNAIIKMVPGADFTKINNEVTNDLNSGLIDLGLITDTTQAWQMRFWIHHGWSHHIGLLVHDVSEPWLQGGADLLKPGMIYTMEPGLYFPENYLDQDTTSYRRLSAPPDEWETFIKKVGPLFKKYVNIGVRIEDDVLITPTGNNVITSGVPKEIADIEKLMKEKGRFN